MITLTNYDALVYQAKSMRTPPSPQAVTVALSAAEKRVVICVGSGVSRAKPSSLLLGAAVAERIYDQVRSMLGPVSLEGAERDNLLSVANAIERLDGGRALLQALLPKIDRFTSAKPNFSHHVLAALALEGAISIVSTNWDNCIERATDTGLVIRVAITDEDRSRVRGAQLLKVHGCATKQGTLLVSSAQLSDPPIWVEHEMGALLADSVVVFVGLGDVAEYVQVRVRQLLDAVGHLENVKVVAPGISETWSSLLPNLGQGQRVSATSDEFLDDLVRAYVLVALTRLSEKVRGHIQAGDFADLSISIDVGHQALLANIEQTSGMDLLLGLQRASLDWPNNQPVILSPEMAAALLAVCVLAAKRSLVGYDQGLWQFEAATVALLLCREIQSYDVLREAKRRVEGLKADGRMETDTLFFLVDGHEGPLPEELFDVVDTAEERDIIDGVLATSPQLISARAVNEGTVPLAWAVS